MKTIIQRILSAPALLALLLLPARGIEPTWDSMAANYRCPDWLQDGKIGIWLHWGPQSILEDEDRPFTDSYTSWMYGVGRFSAKYLKMVGQEKAYENVKRVVAWHTKRFGPPSEFGYEKLIPLFKAEKWDPDGLVKLFKDSGARFVVPISTHVDNFDMWDSSFPWNSVAMGPKRDVVGEWKKAADKYGLKFGVSSHHYMAPGAMEGGRPYHKSGTLEGMLFMVDYDNKNLNSDMNWNKHWFERTSELIEKYKPDFVNVDGPFPDEKRGNNLGLQLFANYINRDLKENNGKQTVVVAHKSSDKNKAAFTYNTERGMSSEIRPYPWLWATSNISGTWFYWKPARNKMPVPVLIGNIVDTVSKNGVMLANVALRADGTLPESQAAILHSLGAWMAINGEGIYSTRPWKIFGEGPTKISDGRQGENVKPYTAADIRFTSKPGELFVFVLAKPTEDIQIASLRKGGELVEDIREITLLGSNETVKWDRTEQGLSIKLPANLPDQPVIAFKASLK